MPHAVTDAYTFCVATLPSRCIYLQAASHASCLQAGNFTSSQMLEQPCSSCQWS